MLLRGVPVTTVLVLIITNMVSFITIKSERPLGFTYSIQTEAERVYQKIWPIHLS